MNVHIQKYRELSRRAQAGLVATLLALASATPVLFTGTAEAGTLAQRTLSASTARPGQAVDLTWTFNTPNTAGSADKIEIEFCDTPLGACAVTRTPTLSNTPTVTLAGPWATTTTTGLVRADGDSAVGGSNNQYEFRKSTVDSVQNLTSLTISFAPTDITNNATANASYYTRLRIYSDNGTTLLHDGVFAQSTSRTLTVNARVQERLDFCVGATPEDDDTTSVANDCGVLGGTSVDVGNVESGQVNVSPVAPVNGGSNENGVAMVRTNAINGVVVDYKTIQETSSGALKIVGATCSAPSPLDFTDGCFNSADSNNDPSDGATAQVIAAGTERFGMTIAGVNCGSTTAYSCTTATSNIVRDAEYDGDGTTTYVGDADQEATTSASYAWLQNGVADRIASSAGSAVKVVDDEALILKFAATAGITTPTGAYSVQADFIATATF